ncbi:hypothetical protein B0T20DRAFT_26988 [Sordaria brevicollis]|uniref:Uncharacterized protein n=1 Tax=Sordaria brevicollis TaxID=83679 RepID=A0AAE0PP46_SORBR|nr:hypothetical protein B0T20DRAFT_26988 [Sordaria brevicollis]
MTTNRYSLAFFSSLLTPILHPFGVNTSTLQTLPGSPPGMLSPLLLAPQPARRALSFQLYTKHRRATHPPPCKSRTNITSSTPESWPN